MIVSTCGYGSSGASAVLDFLRGYDCVNLFDSIEFQLLHEADGLSDLKYQLTENRERITCNTAIKRFLRLKKSCVARGIKRLGVDFDKITDAYIESLVQVSWKGISNYDPQDVSNVLQGDISHRAQRAVSKVLRAIYYRWHFPFFKQRYFSLMTAEEFDKKTKNYLYQLFDEMGYDLNKDIVTDMLFSATNPTLGMEFFDDAKAIVVVRDPRDLYLAMQRKLWTNSFQPWDSVKKFTIYYKSIFEHSIVNDDNRVLRIHYEDLIYNYEHTTRQIMDFLGYTERPKNEFKFFDPDISVKYTKRFVNSGKYKEDIEYIEKELADYLYEFKEYKAIR